MAHVMTLGHLEKLKTFGVQGAKLPAGVKGQSPLWVWAKPKKDSF